MFGCWIIDHLCGQELAFFISVFFIVLYYLIVGILKLTLRFFEIFDVKITGKGLVRVDLVVEALFYIVSILLCCCEGGNPFRVIICLAILSADLVFAFVIFRTGLVSRYQFSEDIT